MEEKSLICQKENCDPKNVGYLAIFIGPRNSNFTDFLDDGEVRITRTKKSQETPYFYDPKVYQSYNGTSEYFSNLSRTITKIHTEVHCHITIRPHILSTGKVYFNGVHSRIQFESAL